MAQLFYGNFKLDHYFKDLKSMTKFYLVIYQKIINYLQSEMIKDL